MRRRRFEHGHLTQLHVREEFRIPADWRELALTQASKKERKVIHHSHNKVSSKKTRFDARLINI